jgi:DNA-directed RNA polymerase specialized sigma24 family protein
MSDLPVTTTVLLERLSQGDGLSAWTEIDTRYRPVLRGFARALGLAEADAEDAAQWTLAEFARLMRAGEYQRERGRLRSWVMGIARHRVQMLKRSAARRRGAEAAAGGGAPQDLPDERTLSEVWDRETQRAVFERAWERVRSSGRSSEASLRVFELVVLRGMPAERRRPSAA